MPIVYPVFELVADPKLPIVRGRRDLRASPQQIFWAHTDPESFARWFGPADRTTRILYWDARPGGGFRYVCSCQDDRDAYRGAFHEVRPDRIVQTFASESMPDEIALETIRIIDLHDGVTRVELESLTASYAARDLWLSDGRAEGYNQGFDTLERLALARMV
ncbi:SRPBCC domain-containing protein [Nigerium sp.]|uniref:SRPBCC domain-containing protein n=1 Tax=Nigerium sp. TaxID=2042655 RepID=UPI0032213DC7